MHRSIAGHCRNSVASRYDALSWRYPAKTIATGQGDGPLTVTFFYKHDGFWRQRARVGLVDGPSLGFTQFMLP